MKTMKTVKSLFALIAIVAMANFAYAGGRSKVNITPLSNEKAIVSVYSETENIYKLQLIDKNGQVIYSSKTNKNGSYNNIFDFGKLKDGEYKMSISNNEIRAERKFSISNNGISVGEHYFTSAPVFNYKDNAVSISYLNFEDEKLSLKLYDGNDVIYTKELEDKFAITERLNLKNLSRGDYRVVVENDNFNYSFTVRK